MSDIPETCGNCRYFEDFGSTKPPESDSGECCANPPTLLIIDSGATTMRPDVGRKDRACRFWAP